MGKMVAAKGRARRGPVSVALTPELQRRITDEGKRRGLKVSTALRVLVTERLEQLEDEQRQTAAETWQRREAWSTWEKLKKDGPDEAPQEELAAVFRRARKHRP